MNNQVEFSNWLAKGNKFMALLNNEPTQLNFCYETEFRRIQMNKLIKQLHSRRNEIEVCIIADWTDKTPDHLKRNIPQRNGHKNRFHVVDVLKFLCDLWNIEYPDEYYTYGEKYGILNDRA